VHAHPLDKPAVLTVANRDLPRDVREEIYDYFELERFPAKTQYAGMHMSQPSREFRLGLLTVNRQIHQEFAPRVRWTSIILPPNQACLTDTATVLPQRRHRLPCWT
jgi:hypothetical protein